MTTSIALQQARTSEQSDDLSSNPPSSADPLSCDNGSINSIRRTLRSPAMMFANSETVSSPLLGNTYLYF